MCGGRIAWCRSSILSQIACPTKWLEIAKAVSPLSERIFQRSLQYSFDSAAASTSKWSPQQASSSPSNPIFFANGARSFKGRSAHWPVNKVTGLAMIFFEGGKIVNELHNCYARK